MTKVFNPKRQCPKCGGSVFLDRDYYPDGGLIGWYYYESCLQCGYVHYPDTAVRAEEKVIRNAFIPAKAAVGAR